MQARPSENCIISSLRWVPKGCFSLHPKKADLFTTNEEIEKYKQDMEEQEQYEIMRKKYEESSAAMTDVDIDNDEELKEYNMADYDNEEEIDVRTYYFYRSLVTHTRIHMFLVFAIFLSVSLHDHCLLTHIRSFTIIIELKKHASTIFC